MIRRVLSAIFAAVLFAVAVPFAAFWMDAEVVSLVGFWVLLFGGGALGLALGALFPKVFGFVFWMAVDVSAES
jgi:hypothetical protein